MFVLPKTPAERALQTNKSAVTSVIPPFQADEAIVQEAGGLTYRTNGPVSKEVTPLTAEEINLFTGSSEMPEEAPATPAFVKHDSGKLLWDLLPWHATEEVVEVLTYGARKYTPNNWRNAEGTSRFFAAAMRHIVSYITGQKRDPETGIHHLAHAICNLMFIIEWERDHNVTD